MYLSHFKLNELPFSLTPNTQFYYQSAGHSDALNTLILHLKNGEGFIKVTGNVGSGKTLLCRMLLENLGDDFYTAYIPNPDIESVTLRKHLAKELGIPEENFSDQHALLTAINERLMELHRTAKKVVLVVDEAQALPTESLETLRLLTNLETPSSKLLQIVLFGQSELDARLKQGSLRQLKQRIGFSNQLPLMKYSELAAYVNHRLQVAGFSANKPLFTHAALWLLFHKSHGVPRLINIFCHKALMSAYGHGRQKVILSDVRRACKDTEATASKNNPLAVALGLTLAAVAIGFALFWRF